MYTSQRQLETFREVSSTKIEKTIKKLQEYLPCVKRRQGANIVLCLMSNPRVRFPYYLLADLVKDENFDPLRKIDKYELIQSRSFVSMNMPIAASDGQTLKEITRRENKLKDMLETNSCINGMELYDSAAIEAEIKALKSYRFESFRANGKPTVFLEQFYKHGRSVKISIKRFLDELDETDVELKITIERNLDTKSDIYTIEYKDLGSD